MTTCESCHLPKADVELREDPYLAEVRDEIEERYWCHDCWAARKSDV